MLLKFGVFIHNTLDSDLTPQDSEYIGRMLSLELPGRRSRRRAKWRFVAVEKEDMKVVGVIEKGAEDRVTWRQIVAVVTSKENRQKKKKKKIYHSFTICLFGI